MTDHLVDIVNRMVGLLAGSLFGRLFCCLVG
jgi:hypothetical protein